MGLRLANLMLGSVAFRKSFLRFEDSRFKEDRLTEAEVGGVFKEVSVFVSGMRLEVFSVSIETRQGLEAVMAGSQSGATISQTLTES